MTSPRLRFVIAFCWSVAAAGALILLVTLPRQGIEVYGGATFLTLAAGVLLGELVPLKLPLRGGDEEANLSTPFAFALLLTAGLAPALIAQVTASVIQDVVARKPVWRCAFNGGQYVVCLAAAGAVLSAFSLHPDTYADATTVVELGSVLLAGGAFFFVNYLIVGTAVAAYQGRSLLKHLRNDARTTTLMAGVSISLAPLVLAALSQSPLLLGLFALPFVAVHRSGQLACESARLAMHDSLTGLPNRSHFRQLVDEAIGRDRSEGDFAVMLLDLNRFKEINDTLGHHYGDLFLRETASRLHDALPQGDAVARLGGDEFAVLARGDAVGSLADRLSATLRMPVELDGILLEVDASFGTARYPQDGTELETLLRRADVAMYTAKSRNLGHVRYSPDIDEYDPSRLALVADLRRAVDADELVLFYQPKLDLQHRTIRAVEALVRWPHPRLGLLQPGAFVQMAEHTGLIKPLTQCVLKQAVRQCAAWGAQGLELQVAVNVSPRSLLDRAFPETVAAALQEAGLSAARLKLEITETAIMVDPAAALEILDELAAMGVALSIDDFGTGYSSLAHLRRLPVNEVKIDKSFVQSMMLEGGDLAIVRSTIDLAANLGLTVVAEGVEDAETLEELGRLGCNDAQGYFVSRPLPASGLSAWLLEPARTPTPRREAPSWTLEVA